VIILELDAIKQILKSLSNDKMEIRVDALMGIPFLAHFEPSNLDTLSIICKLKNIGQIITSREFKILFRVGGHSLQCSSSYISHTIISGSSDVLCQLSLPTELKHQDAREYSRIFISADSDLKAQFISNGTELPVTLVDISPCGAKIANRRLELPSYEIGSEGMFEVSRRNSTETFQMVAVIMWKHGQEAGILLTEKKNIDLRDPNDSWLNFLRRILELSILKDRSC